MTAHPCFVYSIKGESKLLQTLEERDAHYATGEWHDSPARAKEVLDAMHKAAEERLASVEESKPTEEKPKAKKGK